MRKKCCGRSSFVRKQVTKKEDKATISQPHPYSRLPYRKPGSCFVRIVRGFYWSRCHGRRPAEECCNDTNAKRNNLSTKYDPECFTVELTAATKRRSNFNPKQQVPQLNANSTLLFCSKNDTIKFCCSQLVPRRLA